MWNPSLFHYVKNTNSLVSRKSLISLMYVTSDWNTLIISFSTKSSILDLFLKTLCAHIYQDFDKNWQKEYLSRFLCPYWTVQVFNCMLCQIWNGPCLITWWTYFLIKRLCNLSLIKRRQLLRHLRYLLTNTTREVPNFICYLAVYIILSPLTSVEEEKMFS